VGTVLQFVIAGLVLGGIYAIASAGLVITYTSSGILNFAFGALAFFIARFYYYLHTQESWSIWAAAIVAIGVAAPLLGVLLYVGLFRFLRLASSHQSCGDHRSVRRNPVAGHSHLRLRRHSAGTRART
jgi:branched-chain amino acid transport system permease protein